MICRTCLRRAAALSQRTSLPVSRQFSSTIRTRNAATATAAPAVEPSPDASQLDGHAAALEKTAFSSCPKGTVLNGLNYFKNRTDPVASADEDYPEWLWRCLDVQKKADTDEADAEGGDEFSKSKKQRRLAAKRQRELEAKMLDTGDLSALEPKIPLQKQSINLPGGKDATDAVHAAEARETLRHAMRKERKSKIKEANYLKTM